MPNPAKPGTVGLLTQSALGSRNFEDKHQWITYDNQFVFVTDRQILQDYVEIIRVTVDRHGPDSILEVRTLNTNIRVLIYKKDFIFI